MIAHYQLIGGTGFRACRAVPHPPKVGAAVRFRSQRAASPLWPGATGFEVGRRYRVVAVERLFHDAVNGGEVIVHVAMP